MRADSAARHVFHMLYYEKVVALPSMGQWLGEPNPSTVDYFYEDAAWDIGHDLEVMLADFREVRDEQILLLPKFDTQA